MPQLIGYTCDLVTLFDKLQAAYYGGGSLNHVEFFTCSTCGEEREDGYKVGDRIVCAECAREDDNA